MGRPAPPQKRRPNPGRKPFPPSRRGNVRGKVQNAVPLTRKPIIRDPINYSHVVHLLTQHCDPRVIEQRIKKVLGFHETDKPFNLEDFGVKNYVDKTNGKINGELQNKRPDTRLVEISLDGQEAQPISYDAPLHPLQETPVEELEIVKEGLITAEKVNEILEAKKTGKKLEIDLKEDITEEQSKKLRDNVQVLVGHFIYATVSNKKLIVRKYVPIKDKRTDSWLWEKSHVKFVLARNLRFPNILERVAKILGLKSHKNFNRTHLSFDVGYVHQFIQVKQIDPVSIKEAFEKENANVSNFELVDDMLEKNVFRGHKLKFSIRKVTSSEEEIENAMENFSRFGYINYFFATPSVLARASITEVGRSLIKNDFMGAAKVLIRPRPLDRSGYEELKALSFICQDAGVIAPIIREQIHPNNTNLAARVLNVMVNDPQGRLSPRNAHLAFEKNNTEQISKYTDLYLQYIFNETVNKMIEKRSGIKLVAGDLVFKDKESEEKVLYEDPNLASLPKDSIKEGTPSYKEYVKIVTQSDIDNGEYGVFDMVLPLPGYDVVYPENEVKEIYNELLKKDKIDEGVDYFEKNQKVTSSLPIAFRGTYRKVVLEPLGLQWSTSKYTKLEMPLILDDVPKNVRVKENAGENGDKMETDNEGGDDKPEVKEVKEEASSQEEKMETEETPKPDNGEEKKEVDGVVAETAAATPAVAAPVPAPAVTEAKPKKEPVELTAVIVEFFLPKGTHFIVPIRELLKKNEFGALANPFFERLVEKPHIDRFKKTLKHMAEHFYQLQFAPPPMRHPMGPPRPFPMGMPPAQPPDFALQKIQMLEAEIQNLRAQNQASQITQLASLNTALNTLLTQRDGPSPKGGPGGSSSSRGDGPRGNIRALFDEDGPYDQVDYSRIGTNYTDFETNNQPQLKRLRADFGRGNPEQNNKNQNRYGGGGQNRAGGMGMNMGMGMSGMGMGGMVGNQQRAGGYGGGVASGPKGKFFGNNRGPGMGMAGAANAGQNMQGKRQGFGAGGGGAQKNAWQQQGGNRGGHQKRGNFGNIRRN